MIHLVCTWLGECVGWGVVIRGICRCVRGEGVSSCVRAHLHYLLSCFCLMVSYLTFIKKGRVCQKWLFFSNEISFCCNEKSFFYLALVFVGDSAPRRGFDRYFSGLFASASGIFVLAGGLALGYHCAGFRHFPNIS